MNVLPLMLALVLAAPAQTFDPSQAAMKLGQGIARARILKQVIELGVLDLRAARAANLGVITAAIAADIKAPHTVRVLGVRASVLLGGQTVSQLLAPLTTVDDSPEAVALAREAARGLRQMGAHDALVAALEAKDPEVRAHAASSGAGGARLCALLNDPWPDVRIGAVKGLMNHPEHLGCVVTALQDKNPRVVTAAVVAAGQGEAKVFQSLLRAIFEDTNTPKPARVEAIVSLRALGDLEPAAQVLQLHLAKGGVVALAAAAVRAMGASPVALEVLQRSKNPAVRLAAARALGQRQDADIDAALAKFAAERLAGHHRIQLEHIIERRATHQAPALGEVTVDDVDDAEE